MHLPCNQERCPIHPLLQGADTYSNNPDSPVYDSSPLARGRRSIIRDVTALGRFIPSCEGQTLKISNACLCSADSSPLARGRHISGDHIIRYRRFIPSCEGQTLNVYAAFSRLKHFVVQFAQMLFFPHPHLQYAEKSATFSIFKCFLFFNSHHKRHSGSV